MKQLEEFEETCARLARATGDAFRFQLVGIGGSIIERGLDRKGAETLKRLQYPGARTVDPTETSK
jgi:hypothetical protein